MTTPLSSAGVVEGVLVVVTTLVLPAEWREMVSLLVESSRILSAISSVRLRPGIYEAREPLDTSLFILRTYVYNQPQLEDTHELLFEGVHLIQPCLDC
jgi:hypothetical protein